MTVEYHPAVEQEITEVRDFYEQRSPGPRRITHWMNDRHHRYSAVLDEAISRVRITVVNYHRRYLKSGQERD
jgi:hypothetical protein